MLTQLLILSLIEVNVNKGGRIKCPYSVRQSRDHWVPNYLTFILIRLGKQVSIDDTTGRPEQESNPVKMARLLLIL